MGITGLSRTLKEQLKTKPGISEVPLETFSGKRVAIDISIYIHGFVYNQANKKPNNHIAGFFEMIFDLLKNGITPVMVLDGKPPEAKADTIRSRSDNKIGLRSKVEALSAEIDKLMETVRNVIEKTDEQKALIKEIVAKQTELEKYDRRDIKIQGSMFDDLTELFKHMGIPLLQAKGEADALCVRLYQQGLAAGVLSEDMDILPFGGCLIRGIKDKRIPTVTQYDLPKILKGIDFTQEQLVDLCILCGCDYTYATKIRNIGPKTAISLIRKHKNIEAILDNHILPDITKKLGKSKYSLENVNEFKKVYPGARKVFLESVQLEEIPQQLSLGKLDQSQLLPFLMERCRYRPATIGKKIKVILPQYSTASSMLMSTHIQAKPEVQAVKIKKRPKIVPRSKLPDTKPLEEVENKDKQDT